MRHSWNSPHTSYYALGLLAILIKGLEATGLAVDEKLLSVALVPIVLGAMYLVVKRFQGALTNKS